MRLRFAVALATTALAATMTPGHAAAQSVVAPPGAGLAGIYDTPVTIAAAGVELRFVNLDVASTLHNVESVARGPNSAPWCGAYQSGKCPLFVSDLVPAGGTSTADLRNVVAGQTYAFICTVHQQMKGSLQVVA